MPAASLAFTFVLPLQNPLVGFSDTLDAAFNPLEHPLSVLVLFCLGIAGILGLVWRREPVSAPAEGHSDWLRSVLLGIEDGIIAAGPDRKIRFMNRTAESLTGWTEQDAFGEPLDQVFCILDKSGCVKFIDSASSLPGGKIEGLDGHAVLLARCGAKKNIAGYGFLMKDPDGFDAGITLVFREARSETRAAGIDRLLASIVESSDDAIYAKTLEGKILSWNAGAERIFGYSAEEMIGKNISLLVPPDMQDEVPSTLQKLAQGERIAHYETVRMRKDGSRVYVSMSLSPLADEEGRITGASSLARDITERKLAEEALRRTAEELDRSNKELEQFAYIASHDMQEPLRTITGYLQLLSSRYKGQIDEKADRYINYAVEGAERMSTLIHDLLSYSRVNTRGEEMRLIESGESLQFALHNLRSSIEQSGAKITFDPLPVVFADGTQLTQLFQNLVGNAIKYRSPDRIPEIHISAHRDAGSWIFEVRDNGIGFEQQYEEKMFLIFQRLHSRGKYPGTGIGLAICKRIIERHGGQIWAIGNPGEGASFNFSLPMQGKS